MHVRIGLAERQNRARDAGGERRRRGEADLQFTDLALMRAPGQQHGAVHLLQYLPRLVEKQLAGLGERHTALVRSSRRAPISSSSAWIC